MFYHRAQEDRGQAYFGWLDSRHSFSFGHYYDPQHMGISTLRVLNEDHVAPGAGFERHGHRDMEIVSYVLSGIMEHKDSLGNTFVIPAGDVQRMTAGTGITHSEFNASETEPMSFLQIWIVPNQKCLTPGYEQKTVKQTGPLTPLVTPNGRDNSLTIHQDTSIYRLQLKPCESYPLSARSRAGYLHILEGSTNSQQGELHQGDGLGMINETLTVTASDKSIGTDAGSMPFTALWFDMPKPSSGP